ncbi:MAG: type II toxin-antitoxin system VapC family toxin [Planktothrix sp.]|uniref:type II toxin-antitoxin system VapC family toxin n=1 Tax=Planktothrix sp. TaxID=3088171 RepID=UPI0038D38D42
MADKIFIDTVAWIALLNSRDNLHQKARLIMDDLIENKNPVVTTEFVLMEVADAISAPRLRPKTIDFIDNILLLPILLVIPASQDLWKAGWQLYKQRSDKEWGLTDCTSFIVMKQENIKIAFTADRHFEQAGFIKLM